MNQVAKIETGKARGLTSVMAEKFAMEPSAFVKAIKKTVMKEDADDAQVAAFLMVAHEYDLNPLTKEIYAFPSRGGIQPIVSIDGWMKLINRHDQFDGMEFEDHIDGEGELSAITCRIYRKDRSRATEATEYMKECARQTEPWQKWPKRMLRHKAAIQCARYAFSFAMMDEDDFDRMRDVTPVNNPKPEQRLQQAQISQETAQDEQDGFSTSHVQEALNGDPETPTEETEQTTGDEFSPSSDEGDAGDQTASPSPELMEAVKKLFTFAKEADASSMEERPEYRGRFKELAPDYKAKVPESEHDQLKAIINGADAVIKGDQDYDVAIQFFAEQIGFDPQTLELTE